MGKHRYLAAVFVVVLGLVGPFNFGRAAADHPKRGWAGSEQSKVEGTNSSWFYDWSDVNAEPVTSDAEFVPMFYSAADVTPRSVANLAANYPNATHVLGMNEPDQPSQGTSTVAEALAVWPLIESTGLRTVSPANLSDSGGRAWSQSFLNQAENLGYRVDVVGVHWYGNFFSVDYNNPAQTAARFLTDIDSWWTEHQKPLWITEFGVRETSGQVDDALVAAHNTAFLQIVLPQLDNLAYVERYAWFQWEQDLRLIGGNPLTPTHLGEVWASAATPGVTRELAGTDLGDDLVYLRGGVVANNDRVTTATVRNLQVLASLAGEVGVLGGLTDWDVSDGYFWSRPGSAVRKEGRSEVGIHDSDFFHSGVVEIAEGTLRLSGSTTVSGVGSLAVLPGGALQLGRVGDTVPMAINRSIELRGGDIVAPAGASEAHRLTGTQQLLGTTRFVVDGELELFGSVTGTGGAGLVKSGSGVLRLGTATTLDGPTLVESGVLVLGFDAPLTGSPQIEIASGAAIDVSARRLGLALGDGRVLAVESGSAVIGDLFLNPGATLEVMLDSADDHLPLAATRSLQAGGALVVTLAGDAPVPQAGDAFHLFDTPLLEGEFDELELPALDAGLAWNDTALLTTGVIHVGLVGDYNADGRVDAADYTVWRDQQGNPTLPNRDPTLSGAIGEADRSAWLANFGRVAPSPTISVPEAGTRVMAILGLLASAARRRWS